MAEAVLFITGPTASGKSALAVAVARGLGGEVVSADSRQVYLGMDIGTAKPTTGAREGIPHHGFDRVSPAERYSAGRFAREARQWIAEIRARGRVPVVAGGTGFYLRALTQPLFEEPDLGEIERSRLRARLAGRDVAELRRWVSMLEPASPALDTAGRGGGGRQRFLRAIEVAILTGRPLGWWQRNRPAREAGVPARYVVLEWPRDELYRRIDRRACDMVRAGWVDEVRRLVARGFGADSPGVTATGYGDILSHVEGRMALEDALESTRRATRAYARRQLTWLRNQLPADALRLRADRPFDELVENTLRHWKECRV